MAVSKSANWFSAHWNLKTLSLTVALFALSLPAFAATPRFAYVANYSNTVSVYSIDQTSVVLSASGTASIGGSPLSLAIASGVLCQQQQPRSLPKRAGSRSSWSGLSVQGHQL